MILGIGNPLLDISVHVDYEFLKKYGLKPNSAILAGDAFSDMLKDIRENYKDKIKYTSGGSCQNTFRAIAWAMKRPNIATFMGCVGNDEEARIMKDDVVKNGLEVVYEVNRDARTGVCIVALTDNNRSLIAKLNAASLCTIGHFDANWFIVEKSQYYYCTGFFLSTCSEAIMRIAKYSLEQNRKFIFNVSAPAICSRYCNEICNLMPYIDILIGNNDEIATLYENVLGIMNTEYDSLHKKIKYFATMPKLNSVKRTVIVTRGHEPIILIDDKECLNEFEVEKIDRAKIIDTNGAGDAFAGGFLSQYIQGKSIDRCIEYGVHLAGIIIQKPGFTLPDD